MTGSPVQRGWTLLTGVIICLSIYFPAQGLASCSAEQAPYAVPERAAGPYEPAAIAYLSSSTVAYDSDTFANFNASLFFRMPPYRRAM